MASIFSTLQPITFTKLISVTSAASSWMLNLFGMQTGGQLSNYYGHGREGSWNIFNAARGVALMTAPGMPAARRPVQPVDKIPFVYPRMHEEFAMGLEEIHNLAEIDDPRTRDIAGETYIQKQSLSPAQRHANWRTAMLVGMLRDSLYINQSGNYWYPMYSAGSGVPAPRINFQLPAGNLSQANMVDRSADGMSEGSSIFGASIFDSGWQNPTADIVTQCQNISHGLFRRHGLTLATIVTRTNVWKNVLKNDNVASAAGIANQPYQEFKREVGKNADGSPKQIYTARLNIMPGVEWIISDDGLYLGPPGSESWNYHIEDDYALFLPPIDVTTFEGLNGSEPTVQVPHAPQGYKPIVVEGFGAWNYLTGNPAAYESFIVDNFLPVPYQNGNRVYAKVQNF